MYSSISAQSKAEVETFDGEITLPSGETFNHRETVKMINFHRQGKYYSNPDDDIFYPLGMEREPHFSKKLDTDTKDYVLTGEGEDDFGTSWVANIKSRTWMRDSGFALTLNDVCEEASAFGSEVGKVCPDGNLNTVETCDLLYLWFDPSVKNIVDSPINEKHLMTEFEIRAMKGWNDVDKLIEKAEKSTENEIGKTSDVIQKYIIWERCGEFQKKDDEGKFIDKEPKYYHTIFAGYGTDEVIAFEEVIEKEDCPYFDVHISKYKNRWLRVGVYERLFGLQQLVNKLVNYNDQANAIASLLLLQSTDKALVARNLLKEAESGLVLPTSSLTQVAIDNRFLSGFLAELMRYEEKADKLCMTPEVITGEKMPSNSTFRGQATSLNVANDAFKNAKDRVAFTISQVLLKKILPPLMLKWNSEDVMEISSAEEEATIYDYYAKRYVTAEFIKSQWALGYNPNEQIIEAFRQRMEAEWDMRSRKVQLKGLFKNWKYGLRINPTGENVNKEQMNEVYFNAITLLSQNPALANNPLFRKYLEANGISPIKLKLEEIQQLMTAGGNQPAAPQGQAPDKLMSMVNSQ